MIKPKWFGGYNMLILLMLLLYTPLVIFGGFGTSDDLSLVAHIGPDYLQDLKYSLSRSGHISRPIYGFVQSTSLHLFGGSYLLYGIFRLVLWGWLLYLAYAVFKKPLGNKTTLLFLYFLSFPIFSSSQLFNAMQLGYILSIIFYLSALKLVFDQKRKHNSSFYGVYFFWSLLALLSCEIVFPLFVFPLFVFWRNKKDTRLFKNISITTVAVFIVLLILKFIIGPLYQIGDDVYGFSFSSHSILQGVYYIFALCVEIPLLIIEVIPFYFSEPLMWLSLLVVPFIRSLKFELEIKQDKRIITASISTILACSFIFILSDYPAVTYGLYNKMLLPSHLFIALIFSVLSVFMLRSKFYGFSYLLAVLWFGSMQMQVINSIRSWDLRSKVFDDVTPVINAIENPNDFVFVEVPYFLPTNYNNEPVFSLHDDFQGGLYLKGVTNPVKQTFPFSSKMLKDKNYWPNHNILNVIRSNNIEQVSCINTSNGLATLFRYKNIDAFRNARFSKVKVECPRAELRSFISNSLFH